MRFERKCSLKWSVRNEHPVKTSLLLRDLSMTGMRPLRDGERVLPPPATVAQRSHIDSREYARINIRAAALMSSVGFVIRIVKKDLAVWTSAAEY